MFHVRGLRKATPGRFLATAGFALLSGVEEGSAASRRFSTKSHTTASECPWVDPPGLRPGQVDAAAITRRVLTLSRAHGEPRDPVLFWREFVSGFPIWANDAATLTLCLSFALY